MLAGRLDGRATGATATFGCGLFAGRLDVVTAEPALVLGAPGFCSGLFAGRLDAVTALCETFIGGFPLSGVEGSTDVAAVGFCAAGVFGAVFDAGFAGDLAAGFAEDLAAGFAEDLAASVPAGFTGDFAIDVAGFAADFAAGFAEAPFGAAPFDALFALAAGAGAPMSRERSPFFSAMRHHEAGKIGDAATVAPLVVVPRNDLRKGSVQHHGACGIDNRRARIATEV